MVGTGRRVTSVFVAGRSVVENGVIPGFDMTAAQAQAQFDGLVRRYPERTWGHPPVEAIFSFHLSGRKRLTDDVNCRPRPVDLAAVEWRRYLQQTYEQLPQHLGERLHSNDGEAAWNDRHARSSRSYRPKRYRRSVSET